MRNLVWQLKYFWLARHPFGWKAAWRFSREWRAWLEDGETDYTPYEAVNEDVRACL